MARQHPGRRGGGDDPIARELRSGFGNDLRAARVRAGLSQMQVAERVGVSQRFVSAIERGEQNVTIGTMVAFARALGFDLVIALRLSREDGPKR